MFKNVLYCIVLNLPLFCCSAIGIIGIGHTVSNDHLLTGYYEKCSSEHVDESCEENCKMAEN